MLVSGGLDSAVALFHAVRTAREVRALTIDFHERPRHEIRSTAAIVEAAGLPPAITVPLPFLKEVDDLRREGELANRVLETAAETYIPARNIAFYALAAYHAEVLGFRGIVGGHIRPDNDTFPDTTPGFFESLERLINTGLLTGRTAPLEIHTPLLGLSKEEVLGMGAGLGVPLDKTWSCIRDRGDPCGTCTSCQERQDAFARLDRERPSWRRAEQTRVADRPR